jgi:hypothetical protein
MDGDMTAWLAALTDFGDVAVLIPVVGAMLIWLLLVFSRAALRWMLAVVTRASALWSMVHSLW